MSSIRSAELKPFVFFMSRERLILLDGFSFLFLLLGLVLQLLDLEADPKVLCLRAIISVAPSRHALLV